MTTGNNNENPYGEYVPGQYSNSGTDANPSGASEAQGNYQVGDYQQNSGANGPVLNGGANYSAPNNYSTPNGYSAPADYSAGGYDSYQQGYGAPVKAPGTGLGIASLILGIIAIITCWFAIGGLAGLVGLILGIMAIVKLGKTVGSKKGLAITGIVLSSIGLVIGTVMTIFLVWVGSIAIDGLNACQHVIDDEVALTQCLEEWEQGQLGTESTTGTSNS